MERLVLAVLLLGAFLPLPASAQLQYFGYVGNGGTDRVLEGTKAFTNFAHLDTTDDLNENTILDRTAAAAQRGLKVTIDIGEVLWCPLKDWRGDIISWSLCKTSANPLLYQDRWQQWFAKNKSVLTQDKLIALAVLDEPFRWQVNMDEYIKAVQLVKNTFRTTSPFWVPKVWMIEGACSVRGYCPTIGLVNNAFSQFDGSRLTDVDWVGIDEYGVNPQTDAGYQSALLAMKNKFPGKKFVYIMDTWWYPGIHDGAFGYHNYGIMTTIARAYYDLARTDPNSVVLGGFFWPQDPDPGILGAEELPCTVINEYIAIGRAITGKTRTHTLPIGRLESIPHGTGRASGWACDPDATMCDSPPRVDFRINGSYYTTAYYPPNDTFLNPQCGAGIAYRFWLNLGIGSSGYPITAFASDPDFGGATLPSNCPDNPACIWYTTANEPKGYMESISPTGTASGWVCDPDAPQVASKVRLALGNGTLIGVYTTHLSSEQAVANECGGGSTHRFSVQLPSWARGVPVYAFAQDLVSGQVQIPWLCSEGWYCTWY
jgi:hypothetical protein